jgi:hypothetical protein
MQSNQLLQPSSVIPQPVISLETVENHAEEVDRSWNYNTIYLAHRDVIGVLDRQKERNITLTTKLNILFVVNGALWTSLTISRGIFAPSIFSVVEVLGFGLNFTLLINAFLPRQEAVTPNLEDTKFLERYLILSPEDYQLKMMANLVQTYNTNRQRIEDVSQSLTYSAYVTWVIALVMMLQVITAYF